MEGHFFSTRFWTDKRRERAEREEKLIGKRERRPEGRSESQIWPRVCLFNATPSDPNVDQIVLIIPERDREKYRERVILIERDRDRREETGRILIRLSAY